MSSNLSRPGWLKIGLLAFLLLIIPAPDGFGQDGATGTWNLRFRLGDREMRGRLSITEKDGALAGVWTGGGGRGEVTHLQVEGDKLTFTRKVRFRQRELQLRFEGRIEGNTLAGTFTTPRGKVEVTGRRARAGAPERALARGNAPKPPPTHGNVRYGENERNVLDFWKAESRDPAPLVVYIHGGGFRGGSKESLNGRILKELLDAGISVAAIHYRLVPDHPLPAAHHDSRRALQFLRWKAKEWNIDKARVGAFGGSAGAQLCMWLGFHNEMAQQGSSDPVARESTRLACVATSGGQTSMDFRWWKKWIPGYQAPHRTLQEMFGDVNEEKYLEIARDISALSLITADDPPIFMSYGMRPGDPVPADPQRAMGWKIHHVQFGVKLKEEMDRLGIEADLKYPGAQTTYTSTAQFFIKKLKGKKAEWL